MARLIVIAGASGAGKSFVLRNLASYKNNIEAVKKLTTRQKRRSEERSYNEFIDLNFGCSNDEIRQCDYTYSYYDNNYGIKKSDIDQILNKNVNPMVIVASCETIAHIRNDYPDLLGIFVVSGLSGEDLKNQLLTYQDPIEIEERMERQKKSFEEYIRYIHHHLFQYFLVNYYDDTFKNQLTYILHEEIEKSRHKEHFVFVVMSFKDEYNDVYENIIGAGERINSPKIKIERISEQKGDYIITEKIEKSIKSAELIICDITERSPNVFYEFGYARAIQKKIIIIANEKVKEHLPFDVSHYRCVFYRSETDLQKKLMNELKYHYGIKDELPFCDPTCKMD